jgi:hypothetical protein
MEEIVAYLEAIDGINHAEREHEASPDSARLRRAYHAAETAWAAIPPSLRRKMAPPPVLSEAD